MNRTLGSAGPPAARARAFRRLPCGPCRGEWRATSVLLVVARVLLTDLRRRLLDDLDVSLDGLAAPAPALDLLVADAFLMDLMLHSPARVEGRRRVAGEAGEHRRSQGRRQ